MFYCIYYFDSFQQSFNDPHERFFPNSVLLLEKVLHCQQHLIRGRKSLRTVGQGGLSVPFHSTTRTRTTSRSCAGSGHRTFGETTWTTRSLRAGCGLARGLPSGPLVASSENVNVGREARTTRILLVSDPPPPRNCHT